MRLTIAIPTYSRAHHLRHALRHAAQATQGMAGVEILVVDNASTDDTATVCREHGVRYHRHDRNLGPDANIMSCFELANGKYVKLCNDNLMIGRTLVEKHMAAIEQAPAVVVYAPSSTRSEALAMDFAGIYGLAGHWLTWLGGVCLERELAVKHAAGLPLGDFMFQTHLLLRVFEAVPHGVVIRGDYHRLEEQNYRTGYDFGKVFISTYLGFLDDLVRRGLISWFDARVIETRHLLFFLVPHLFRVALSMRARYRFSAARLLRDMIVRFWRNPAFWAAPAMLLAQMVRKGCLRRML